MSLLVEEQTEAPVISAQAELLAAEKGVVSTSKAVENAETNHHEKGLAYGEQDAAPAETATANPDSGSKALALPHAPAISLEEKLAPNVASDPFGYEKLDAAQTKAEFALLDAELNQRTETLVQAIVTVEEAMPYIDKMQALLSQRGAGRHKVMKEAGLPTWTDWAKGYAKKLRTSVRTMQRGIKKLRKDGKLCPDCGEKAGDCTCPNPCNKCGQEKTDCSCTKKVSVQERYLRALERLLSVADRAADRHEDEDLAHAVNYAACGMSRQEQTDLGMQPKPKAGGEADYTLTPEMVIGIFLTKQVRREFLTAVANEAELLVILREMARLFYESNQTPEAERNVKVEKQSPPASGQVVENPDKPAKPKGGAWSPERKKVMSETMKAVHARKKAVQAA
jgi:hypothetical protein